MSIKAERATIDIGGIPLNAYMLPGGEYRLAGRNVTDAIEKHDSSLREIMGVKSLKALPHADSSLSEVRAETGEKFIPVAIEDAVAYWAIMASKGNAKALAIVVALATESLERRADRAFNIKRTEQERDERLKLRINRISAFRGWTDCIKDWQEAKGIYGTPDGKKQYADLVRLVNLRLFNQPHFNCDRDTMTIDQQLQIGAFEMNLRNRYRPERNLLNIIEECLAFAEGKPMN